MSWVPSGRTCEWEDLRYFVDEYNKRHNSAYVREKRLDVEDNSSKQPEVLCRDSNGTSMVIERKTLPWPIDDLKTLRALDRITTRVRELATPLIGRSRYEIGLSPPKLFGDKELESYAQQISASAVTLAANLPAGRRIELKVQLPCYIERLPDDFDDIRGISFLEIDGESGHDLCNPVHTPAEFDLKVSNLLADTVSKFKRYSQSKRVLVFRAMSGNVYGDLDAAWWQKYLATHPLNPVIEQIWMSLFDSECGWFFARVTPPEDANAITDVLITIPPWLEGRRTS